MKRMALLKSSYRWLGLAGEAAARLVFPPQCAVCDAYLEGTLSFCARCDYAIFPLKEPRCSVCGETRQVSAGAYAGEDALCPQCVEARPQFERARAYWEYYGSVADAIQRAKYGQRLWIVRNLAAALGPWFRAEIASITEACGQGAIVEPAPALLITYVPMHPSDLRARGFNFGSLLLRAGMRSAGLKPEISRLVIKTRRTRSQAGLGHLDRRINLRGAFEVHPRADVRGRAVLLFDDVLTTGATANEVAKTLRQAGASRVFVLSAARALKY